jgi:hypothetical protein
MKLMLKLFVPLWLLAVSLPPLIAEDFSFSALIRAGDVNGGNWEAGLGPSGNPAAQPLNVTPYYLPGLPQAFEIGYRNATDTAYLRIQAWNGSWRQVNYANPATPGAGVGAGATWTIPTGNLYVAATGLNTPTSITVSNLSLGPGLTVIQGLSTTTIQAAQSGSSVTDSVAAPVIFKTGAGGDWVLSGMVTFNGLGRYQLGGAEGMDLRFGLGAGGVGTPEPETLLGVAAGLVLLTVGLARRRRAEQVREKRS